MPTALLAGAYGQGNLGDDALLSAFARALPAWRLVATASDVTEVERSGCAAVSARNPAAVGHAALTADAVIVGGGTVFKSLHPASNRRPLALLANASALVAAASATRRPVAMIGVGVGQLAGPGALSLSRFVIRRTDLLVLRDEESASGLARAGLPGPFRVAADPAWSLLAPPDGGRGISHGPVRLVPSCLATAGDGWPGLIDRVARLAARLHADGLRVQIQAWQQCADPAFRDDAMLVAHVAKRLGSSVEVVPPSASLPAAAESMRGLGAVVTSRFHALVAAGAAGVPSVAVAHERKLAALARRLGQRTIPVDFEPAQGAALVREAVATPGPSAASVKEQIAQAEEGFRLLRVLLAGGQSEESDGLGALPLVPAPQST